MRNALPWVTFLLGILLATGYFELRNSVQERALDANPSAGAASAPLPPRAADVGERVDEPQWRAEVSAPQEANAAQHDESSSAQTPVADRSEVTERYPDAPGVPGQLPFEYGSLAERAWLLRRALRDLADLGEGDAALTKAGLEALPLAIGAHLTMDGRAIPRERNSPLPKWGADEYLFVSQGSTFVFKRHEFPEYDLYRAAIDAGHEADWTKLGDRDLWFQQVRLFLETAILRMEAR